MHSKPVIFISAVSGEFRTARDVVAKALVALGYEPKWQDIVPVGHGSLRGVLRKWIDESVGVLQILGQRYGAEPAAPDPDFGRCSYTQFEAHYARHRGKKVWYLFAHDTFPRDPGEPEPAELAELQTRYLAQVKASGDLLARFTDALELENTVLRLRDNLGQLRRRSSSMRLHFNFLPFIGSGRPKRQPKPPAPEKPDESKANVKGKTEDHPATPPDEPPPRFHEDARFRIYRPQTMARGTWHPWLAFAYEGPGGPHALPDLAKAVEAAAREALGPNFAAYDPAAPKSPGRFPLHSTLTFQPEVEGLEFYPPQRQFRWDKPWHRQDFWARVIAGADGTLTEGTFTVFLGIMILAEVDIRVLVGTPAAADAGQTVDEARAFRQVFASYSHRDTIIVKHVEGHHNSLGDEYVRDATKLRPGEDWWKELQKMIHGADIFQLF